VGSWYWIGVSAGLAVAGVVLEIGIPGMLRGGSVSKAVQSVIVGLAVGGLISLTWPGGWVDLVVGALAGLLAFYGAAPIVAGAFRRGGTGGGMALLLAGVALAAAGIAFIPTAGYLEAVALPALALRLRRTQPERYAGLRTLAKD
jgi:hypothetical protein